MLTLLFSDRSIPTRCSSRQPCATTTWLYLYGRHHSSIFFSCVFPLEYLLCTFQLRPSSPRLFTIRRFIWRNQPLTCLLVTGTAHHIEPSNSSFSVTVSQLVVGANPPSTVTIHAFLSSTPPWPHTADELPIENQVVRFTAELCSVVQNEPTVIMDLLDRLTV